MNLAGYLFRSVRETGVQVAFACSGADAFLWEEAEGAGLRTVPLGTEQAALDAAGAYLRAAGRPAVVLSSGDGFAVPPAPAAGAVPLLVVIGAGRRPSARPVVRLDDRERAPGLVGEALAAAAGGRGPVVVAVRGDLAAPDVPEEAVHPAAAGSGPPDAEAVDTAGLLLSLAARPIIWAGGGAVISRAWDELAAVADLLGAPIVTSISGKGAVSEAHPLAVGSVSGAPEVARLTGGADAGLAVGTRFSARSTGGGRLPMPMQLVHVDVDTTAVGQRYPARLGIAGDARAVLTALAGNLRSRSRSTGSPAAEETARQVSGVRHAAGNRFRPEASPEVRILDALRAAIPGEVPTVWDVAPARWAVPAFPVPVPGTFHPPAADAGPGCSLAAALGVAAARRGPAVAVIGAGELLRRSPDLAAVAGASLPVVAVAFDGTVWSGGPDAGIPDVGPPRLPFPDPVALGSAFGLPAVGVGLAELPAALGRALASSGPTLIAVERGEAAAR